MKVPHKMTTLSEAMKTLQENGYSENFTIKSGRLFAPEEKALFSPENTRIDSFYRFEGTSDPGDNSVLYAIETKDGVKGLLLDAYGAYADSGITEFIKQVEEISKKKKTDTPES